MSGHQFPIGEIFGVGTISDTVSANQAWNVLFEFDYETYERYSKAISSAHAPLNQFNVELVERNFQSYLNIQKYVSRLMILGREFGVPNRLALAQSIMTQIVNWLTSFRLFLDHAQFDLSRRFGDTSPQLNRFQSVKSVVFDGSVGYRFIYKFRNYVQHCGSPLSSIVIGRQGENGGETRRSVAFTLNRDQLLRDYDGWGRFVLQDLSEMTETFQLEPLARDAMNGVREINKVLLDISIENGARTISDVREALELIPTGEEGVPNLFRFTTDENGEPVNFSPQPLPTLDTIVKYESVASGSLLPSDLHSQRVEPDPPIFDPETINQRFHQDNRAVQIMTMWFAEGGTTTSLVNFINKKIEEDGGVNSILDGFLDVTGVLVHLTAGAIGIDPAGIIGGLLDQYPDPIND